MMRINELPCAIQATLVAGASGPSAVMGFSKATTRAGPCQWTVKDGDLVVVVPLVAPVVDPLAHLVIASKRSGARQKRAADLGGGVGLHERFRGGDSAAQGEHVLLGVAGGEGGLLREVVVLAEDVARAERGSTQDMLSRRV